MDLFSLCTPVMILSAHFLFVGVGVYVGVSSVSLGRVLSAATRSSFVN